MYLSRLLNRVLSMSPVRHVADAGFGCYAQRRAARLDGLSVAGVQRETLLRLVRRAENTRFGRDHGFADIRTFEDYRRRVPLRDYEAFWQDYWQPVFPRLQGATWPGHIPYVALSSGTTTGATKYIPVSTEMLASNRRAALTGLSWFRAAHPEVRLFAGRLFFLGGSTALTPLNGSGNSPLAGDLSGIATRELSSLLRPFTFPPLDLALLADWDQKLERLAEQSVRQPISLIGGIPSWLLTLFERLRRVTGRGRISDIWPSLRVVVHGGTCFNPYRQLFRELIGSDRVRFLETYPASEGFVAAEDPRHGLLRLVPDHDVFFEFVPSGELGAFNPTRHTVADLEPGVQYAVVLTTCAGLWSYVLGDTVCFERRDPPLLRFTGRTKQFLSAFGEHLIGEEVERAVALAAERSGAAVRDFHVGPVFPESTREPGHHRFLVEFARPPQGHEAFRRELDLALCSINEDYRAHRQGNLTMRAPQVLALPPDGFADWMRGRGKLGGQHKVPRLDNTGQLTAELTHWLKARSAEREPVAVE